MLYTLNVAMAFAFLSSLYGDFMKAVGASERIFELMDRTPEVRNEGGARLMEFSGDVEFENVDFTYPSRPDNQVLKVINVHFLFSIINYQVSSSGIIKPGLLLPPVFSGLQ